ncbi:FecR family protein [Azoarcus sp. L1K30]|uniref:FecR domain-containing protein n=1 Tax=Azoarcus sp. L1K30 TaxID=2820277 RepID=UPI001B82DF37|nr:FecR family protein [Azoarcus sp. L1K30]MBR0564960.1 FecR family protein [Azoarcus sp. L1K30]
MNLASIGKYPISPNVAEAAMAWWVELQSEPVAAEVRMACQRWRAASPEHEHAWQIIAGGQQRLRATGLPTALAHASLTTPPGPARRQAIKALAVLVFAGAGGLTLHRQYQTGSWIADYQTDTGERRLVTLADGSQLTLDTGSVVDVNFDSRQRQLHLRSGRIHIATATDDRRRPFLVSTAEGSAQALGTRFTVRQHPGSSEVAVFAGAVALRPLRNPAHPLIINAGQRASFDAGACDAPSATVSTDAAWQQGMLIVNAMRLDDFAAELDRYRPGWLICDPRVASLEVSGSFPLDNTERVLEALVNTLPVQIVQRTRYWTAIQPLPSSA